MADSVEVQPAPYVNIKSSFEVKNAQQILISGDYRLIKMYEYYILSLPSSFCYLSLNATHCSFNSYLEEVGATSIVARLFIEGCEIAQLIQKIKMMIWLKIQTKNQKNNINQQFQEHYILYETL